MLFGCVWWFLGNVMEWSSNNLNTYYLMHFNFSCFNAVELFFGCCFFVCVCCFSKLKGIHNCPVILWTSIYPRWPCYLEGLGQGLDLCIVVYFIWGLCDVLGYSVVVLDYACYSSMSHCLFQQEEKSIPILISLLQAKFTIIVLKLIICQFKHAFCHSNSLLLELATRSSHGEPNIKYLFQAPCWWLFLNP